MARRKAEMKMKELRRRWNSRRFLCVIGVGLAITAAAKAASVMFSNAGVLETPAPVLEITTWKVLLGVAVFEAGIVGYLALGRDRILKLLVVTAVGCSFLGYRALSAGVETCSCLGTVFQGVPRIGGALPWIALGFAVAMVVGGSVYLVWETAEKKAMPGVKGSL